MGGLRGRRRHCYAANDNILLDVRCGDAIMGDETASAGSPKLDVTVHATAPIARIDIVRQLETGQPAYVYTLEPKKERLSFSWSDRAAIAGKTHMYYVRILQQDQRMAWASPIWVKVGE